MTRATGAIVDHYDLYASALAKGEHGQGIRTRAAMHLQEVDAIQAPRLEAPGALLNAALYYASRGVPVFPVEPRGKRPTTEHGLKDATTDEATIRAWWAIRPTHNIGAPTGIKFDVVDIDGPSAVGVVMLGRDRWRSGLIGHALTQRPHGHHLFYRPSGKPNAAKLAEAVDFRGAGGYVLLPPSIGESGQRYRWIKPLEVSA